MARFRKSDAFALVGLLVLLAWTPSYWAQGEEARDFSEGERFHLPERRVGDQMAYSLVVHVEGQEPRMVGPVQRIRVEMAHPDEVPVPAAYVETRTTYPFNTSFGALRFDALPFEDRHFYDEDGDMVWRTLRAVTEPSDDHDPFWVEAGVRTPYSRQGFTPGLTEEVTYEPSAVAATALKVTRDLVAEFTDPRHSDPRLIADRAASFQGRPMYGVLSQWEIANRAERLVDADAEPFGIIMDGAVSLTPRLPHTHLRFDEDREVRGDAKWVWVSPEAPRLIGGHVLAREVGGPTYTIDVLATELVRGTGAVVPLPEDPDQSIFEPVPRMDVPKRSDVQRLPLRAVDTDSGPVFENASLRDVRAALVDAAPASIRSALDAGARITSFRLEPGPTFPLVGGAKFPTLPVDALDKPDDTLVHRSNWTVALVAPDGHTSIARLWLEERPGPSFEATAADACLGPSEDRHHGCGWHSGDIDWERRTIAPSALADTARAELGDGHLARFDPLDQCHRSTKTSALGGWGCSLGLFGTLGDGSNMEWASARPVTLGRAVWLGPDEHEEAAYDLDDGRLLEHWSFTSATPEEARPATLDAAVAPATPTVWDVVGTKTALSGAALIVVTGLFRLVAALRAGLHVPLVVALFSRVSRADVLLHERRADILELLRADPGLTTQAVAERLGYSRTATLHHLETLLRTGQLLYVQNGQQRHYFPPDGTERERVRVAVEHDARYASLLQVLDESPGITLADLTRRLRRSKPRLSRMVARLERLGVVRRQRDGRSLRVFPHTA